MTAIVEVFFLFFVLLILVTVYDRHCRNFIFFALKKVVFVTDRVCHYIEAKVDRLCMSLQRIFQRQFA